LGNLPMLQVDYIYMHSYSSFLDSVHSQPFFVSINTLQAMNGLYMFCICWYYLIILILVYIGLMNFVRW
jgi:hypothetical protein